MVVHIRVRGRFVVVLDVADSVFSMCYYPKWDVVNAVPRACGECGECLRKRPKDWMLRGQLHHALHGDKPAYFITYTYEDEHNPGIVCKPIAQLVKKRYAAHHGYGHKSIMCGEYGEMTGRPHYHMCVWAEEALPYNVGTTDYEAYNPPDAVWPYGKIDVRPLTPERVSYTCGYEVKTGKVKARDRKAPNGVYLPFTLFSQGIGKDYAQKFGKRDMQLGYTPMAGYKKPVSRYVQTHSGHCETYCKIWRMKKNRKTEWQFGPDAYESSDRNVFLLKEEILLTQQVKSDILETGKAALKRKVL